ncbi:prepilin-type N-terminal cleavage/methylation domain-containing protein [Ferrigenium kumadai]|uniref:prepilin-type N-terminal cleavage/methylation domain-containing protein n=1 Tax=Ferrigenium kumadai TaxID=1682490 RepID=UPI001BB354C2|nr:prepilin-type N-terminal cleavage/methylation domain-containing protein [Ferrigenium kumadai]
MGVVALRKGKPLISPAPCLQQGFTLIELLVVLVVMGIALGMVVVQLMPDNRAALREEAQRLALLLENAGMEARASGHPLAWSSEKNGYRFWKKNDYGEWVRLEDDAIFRPYTLPAGLGIAEVSVEGQPLKHGELMSLHAFSFTLPFHISLTGEHASASVTGSSTGAVYSKLDNEN